MRATPDASENRPIAHTMPAQKRGIRQDLLDGNRPEIRIIIGGEVVDDSGSELRPQTFGRFQNTPPRRLGVPACSPRFAVIAWHPAVS